MSTIRNCHGIAVLLPLALVLAACGARPSGADAAMPSVSQAGVTVAIRDLHRTSDALQVELRIVNATGGSLVLARDYRRFPSVTLGHGDQRSSGRQRPLVSRIMTPTAYTVLAGETATVRMDFADPVQVDACTIRVVGRLDDRTLTWEVVLPNRVPATDA